MKKLGIQIGEHLIRVIVQKKQRNQWELIFNETENLPEGIVKNGQILEPERLGLILKEFFLKNKIEDTHASIFIEEAPFFMRHIELPKMNKKEVTNAILYRAQTELPVNPNELVIRSYPTKKPEGKTKELPEGEYMIVAMDKGLINKTAEVFHNAGLTLSSLSIEPIAIYNGILLHEDLKNQLHENFLLVRTDTNRLMLAIFSNGNMIHSRYLPFSTEKKEWEQEISRTLKSWNSNEGHVPVKQIVLYGTEDHREIVEKHMEEITPISLFYISDPSLPCMGITFKKNDELNFYADRVTFNLLKKTPIHVYVLGIVTGFMFLSLLFQYGSQAYVRTQISLLEGNINEHGDIKRLLQKQSQLEGMRANVLKTAREIRAQHVNPIETYQLIAPPTPGIVTFNQIVFDDENIKITGRTGDVQNLVSYYRHLQQNSNLSNVIMNNASSGTGGVQFSFVMNRKGTTGQ